MQPARGVGKLTRGSPLVSAYTVRPEGSKMQEMEHPGGDVENRLTSLEQRLDSLEQVGQTGLPAVRLAAIEVKLEHLELGQRDLKGEMDRRFNDVDKRFDNLGRQLWIVTLPIGLLIAILQIITLTSRTTP